MVREALVDVDADVREAAADALAKIEEWRRPRPAGADGHPTNDPLDAGR
jgi:hypothetical protein